MVIVVIRWELGIFLVRALIWVLCLFAAYKVNAKPNLHVKFASADILYVSEHHKYHNEGMAIELIEQMSRQMNFSYEILYYPWSRAIQVMAQNKADVLIGVYYTPGRAKLMNYGSVPIYTDEIRLFSRPQNPFKWQGNINQLNDLTIALIRGGSYGQTLDAYLENMNVVYVSSVAQQFKLLNKKRVDLTANNVRNTWPILANLQLEQAVKSHQPVLTKQPGYFAFAKVSKHKNLMLKFDRFLNKKQQSGELQALQKQFIPSRAN